MNPIGIYLHVPFCRGKCPYCDFYSVNLSEELLDAYTDETVRRIRALAEESVTADTVYFGGGTPSLLGGKRISRLLSALGSSVTIAKNAEITVEANPSTDLRDFLSGCAASGVNRLSLGMQSAVPRELVAIGRKHTPQDVLSAMETARTLGIDNLSLDLMIGIPHQTGDTLTQSIEFIKNSAPSHVSAYMLKIEEGTPFYRIKDTLPIADDDALADLYEAAFASLEQLGYRQYEISNASREGREGRHNLHYWNDDEYIGIGPAAHGFWHGRRYFYSRSLREYLGGADIDLTKKEAKAINTYLSMKTIYKYKNGEVMRDADGKKMTASHGKAIAATYDDKNGVRDPLEVKDGVQHLDGLQALIYARLREIDNDFVRTARTRHLLDCLLKPTAAALKSGRLDAFDLLFACLQYLKTNMNLQSMITSLIPLVLNSEVMSNLDEAGSLISEFRIPEDNTYKYDTVNGSSVTVLLDKKATTQALHEFIYGAYYPAQ